MIDDVAASDWLREAGESAAGCALGAPYCKHNRVLVLDVALDRLGGREGDVVAVVIVVEVVKSVEHVWKKISGLVFRGRTSLRSFSY